jgi:hypothetical protein
MPVMDIDLDPRRAAIWQLQQTLTAHQLIAEMAESEPVLVVAGSPEEGTRTLRVRCDHRASDEGRLWFSFLDGSEPRGLAEVSRVVDAVTGILSARLADPGWAEPATAP